MKHKIFCAVLIVMFAVLSYGGCGSDSSDTQPISVNSEESSGGISMSSAMDSDDIFQEITERIIRSDVLILGLSEAKIYGLAVSGDGEIWAEDMSLTDEEDTSALYDPDTFAQHYMSGDIILIEDADPALINRIRGDVGEVPEDSGIAGKSGSLEVYAMARRKLSGAMSTYTYAVQRAEDITGGMESAYTVRDFVVDRWMEFFTWIAAVSLITEPADSSGFRASEADIAETADMQKQTFDFSYSNIEASVKPYFNYKGEKTLSFSKSRMNKLGFTVQSAHSFENHKDYYFVRANLSTTPKNFADTVISPWGQSGYTFNYLYGFTYKAGFEAWLNEGKGVKLISFIPTDSLNSGESSSEELSYSIDGIAGAKRNYFGREANDGLSYSNSLSWSPSGYKMIRTCGENYPESAGWRADFELPQRTGFNSDNPSRVYADLEANPASTGSLEYSTCWLWEVDQNQWKANPNMTMNVNFEAADGMIYGLSAIRSDGPSTMGNYTNLGAYHTFPSVNNASMVLNAPPHIILDTEDFPPVTNLNILFLLSTFNKLLKYGPVTCNIRPISNDAHTGTLKILAEDDWTLSVSYNSFSSDWVKLSDYSGNATGVSGKNVQIEIDANSESEGMRYAFIELKSGNDTEVMQITQTSFYADYLKP